MKKRLFCALCALLTAMALVLPAAAATAEELANIIIGDMFKPQLWIDPSEKPEITDYAYSFVVVGDTQIICESYPEKMTTLYDWIIANVESKKIAHVFGLGDITNHSTAAEWQVAKREIAKLDGVVPYSLVRGNHDYSNAFNKIFSTDAYMNQFEGFFQEGRADNTWRTFTVADVDYLFLVLDYGASDAILNWAGEAIAAHPHHRVIISTHAYMTRDGARITPANNTASPNPKNLTDGSANHGEQMWDKLIRKYENIFMVLSGHIAAESVEVSLATGDHGNTVYQFLIDPQGLDISIGATGMVAILYFSEDGQKVTVEQYSTARQKYYRSTSQFDFSISVYDPHSFGEFVADGNATCLSDGTETALCAACGKTQTRTLEGSRTQEHTYADGICAVCGVAAPVVTTEAPQSEVSGQESTQEKPVAEASSESWLMTALLPAAIFFAAVAVGYVLGKKYKRK